MIDVAISHLITQLNQFLRRSFDLAEDIVVASALVEQDGTVTPNIDNKLVTFLVNIEKDTMPLRQRNGRPVGGERSVATYPPIYLNLYLMFAGHFSGNNYLEALKFISHTVSFFQRRPVFDHQNSPELDDRIDRLTLDIENLDIRDLSTLWGSLSGKYLPSILYKVRMVAFDADDVRAEMPTLREPRPSVSP